MAGYGHWYWHRRLAVTDNDRPLSLILSHKTGRYWHLPANIIYQTCGHCSKSRSVSTTTEFGPWQRHTAYSCEILHYWTSCSNPLQSKQINPSITVGFNSEYCRQWSRSVLVLTHMRSRTYGAACIEMNGLCTVPRLQTPEELKAHSRHRGRHNVNS